MRGFREDIIDQFVNHFEIVERLHQAFSEPHASSWAMTLLHPSHLSADAETIADDLLHSSEVVSESAWYGFRHSNNGRGRLPPHPEIRSRRGSAGASPARLMIFLRSEVSQRTRGFH